jgi:hypothetical protein
VIVPVAASIRGRLSGCSSVPTSSVATPNGMIVRIQRHHEAHGGRRGAWNRASVMNDVSVAPPATG